MKRILLLLTIPALLMASDINGVIKDRLDKTPLNDAIVKLVKLPESEIVKTIITDEKGEYFIGEVASGVYQIEVSKPDYYKNVLFDFTVEPQRHYECNIDLLQRIDCRRGQKKEQKQGNEDDSEYCFMIGSIEVKSHGEELIPEEPVTTRKISSGEIEHMQATSLGDVLNLIPGIEKTQNPGLSKSTYVGVRAATISGTDGILESFGTSIIIDDNDVSNAAAASAINGRGGIDLRTIPADNIESVEVISGIPSAEYGDFGNGIIKVKTKSGYIQKKLKAKLNPDTKTASLSGGHKFRQSIMDYHFNYGYSEKDLREIGDEYHRFYGLLGFDKDFFNKDLSTKTKFSFTKTFEGDAPVGEYKIRDYNEGYRATGAFTFDYNKSEKSNFSGLFSINLNNVKEHKEKFISESVSVPDSLNIDFSDALVADTTGDYTYIVGYTGKKKDVGIEFDINSNLKYTRNFEYNGQKHEVMTGIITKLDRNVGDGIVMDPFWNYYGIYSSRKSYSYDDYGQMNQYSAFIQDNLNGSLFSHKYKLMLGLRYTTFNPQGVDFANGFLDSQHGEFLCPRLNFQYFVSDKFRFRLGAGSSEKSVSLSYIYNEPKYDEYVLDGKPVADVELQQNLDLQAYTTTKYEASVDWNPFKMVGFSLTGYYMTSDNMPKSRMYPFGYSVKPDTITAANYSVYENNGWKDDYGVEFMLRTKRIKNLQFKMNFTYRYSNSGEEGLEYDDDPEATYGEEVWFKPSSTWREKIILDYQINYVSQRLGAWVTLDVQQIPLDNKQNDYHSIQYDKDINGTIYPFYQGMTYWYDSELYEYGGRWLFNLRITKSLSQKTEFSLYVNNLFDDRALWNNPFTNSDSEKNPEIYYGLEVSAQW